MIMPQIRSAVEILARLIDVLECLFVLARDNHGIHIEMEKQMNQQARRLGPNCALKIRAV